MTVSPDLQTSFGSLGAVFYDLAKEPASLHGTAPVDGETEPSVAIVVDHLKQQLRAFTTTLV